MKLTNVLSALTWPLAILALTSACQKESDDDDIEGSQDAVTGRNAGPSSSSGSSGASSSTAATGKYISNGKMLMIYGRCSPDNFLGGSAKGALGADGQTISVEEGNVCGSYKIVAKSRGVVSVTWIKPAGSHLGGEVEQGCRSPEGEYAMTVAGAFEDLTPGLYKKGAVTLRVDPGCESPSLIGNTRGTIVPKVIGGKAQPFFQVEEGNVCGGYLIEKQTGGLKVTWQRPVDAHLGDEVIRSCASIDGTYANTNAPIHR